jgi:hypothetical protein
VSDTRGDTRHGPVDGSLRNTREGQWRTLLLFLAHLLGLGDHLGFLRRWASKKWEIQPFF